MADITLPPLPALNESPWYTKRTAWDLAVKSQIENLTGIIQGVVATVNIRDFPGADPTGATDSISAWNALIAEVPNATKVILDGNYRFNDTLTNNGKSIHVEAYGSTITRGDVSLTANPQLALFSGSYGTVNMVSSMSVAAATGGLPETCTLNLAAPATDLAEGDYVRVVCDNYVPASRFETSRAGFSAIVASVSGSTVTLFGGPYSGDTFTTNIRIARVDPVTASWRGGNMTRTPGAITPALGGSMVYLRDLQNATIADVTIPLSSGAGFQLAGCTGTLLENLRIDLLRDSWSDTGTSGPVFAYHVLDMNSQGTHVRDSAFFGGRHGFSTAQTTPGSGGGVGTNMRSYGVVEHALIEGVYVEGTYVAGFDTHEASRGVVFDNCVAVGTGYAGYGLRGRDHIVTNSQAIDCYRGVYVFDGGFGGDSYGHKISNVLIDNPMGSSIEADMIAKPPAGIKNLEADNVTVRKSTSSPIKLTNARVGKIDMNVTWASSGISADKGIIESHNSEMRGGNILSDNTLIGGGTNSPAVVAMNDSGDTSIVEVERIRVLGTSAQTARFILATGGTATPILHEVITDDTPVGNSPAANFSTSGVLDYKTMTGDDSGRLGVGNSTTDLELLGRSLHPTLTVQATITSAKTLPNLPAGRVQGQVLTILNRPATGVTGQSTANLTVNHGGTPGAPNGARTWLTGATNKVLTPGQACRLQWDATIARWCEII